MLNQLSAVQQRSTSTRLQVIQTELQPSSEITGVNVDGTGIVGVI